MMFWGGEGSFFPGAVNYMISDDHSIYAEVAVPEDASEDYGYITMQKAILAALEKRNITIDIDWCFGEGEDGFPEDAAADCDVYVDIDEWEIDG